MKNIAMTKIVKLLLLSAMISAVQPLGAQSLGWSTPEPFTGSLSDNTNADLKYLWNQNRLVLVWERSENPNSNAIYMRDVLGSDPEIEILSDSNTHYMNPRIFRLNTYYGSDTLFFLFYETESNGVNGLYYKGYLSDGSFTTSTPFFPSSQGETGFDCNDYQHMAWISDGNLYYSHYNPQTNTFSDPALIDSGGCANPKIGNFDIFWEKESPVGNHIYRSTGTSPNNWSEPIPVYTASPCANLNKDGYSEIGILFTWSAFHDPDWKIMVSTGWVQTLTPTSTSPFQPAITSYHEGCIPNIEEFFISFPYWENGFNEIFISQGIYAPDFVNLSQSGSANHNPNFFTGEWIMNCYYLYNIWECEENGFWQLHYSRIQFCIGNVGENTDNNYNVTISPNPFTTSLQISCTLQEITPVSIEITDLFGRRVGRVAQKPHLEGTNIIEWKPDFDLKPGVYLINVVVGNRVCVEKVVKKH